MDRILTAALACGCLFGAASARGGDRDDALAIIDQAIQAQGGADALAKARTAVRGGEGLIYPPGDKPQKFTDELTLDLPDRWRESLTIEKQVRFTMAVAGDKSWQATGGTVSDIGAERLREIREEIYVLWLETLTPLKEGFDLAPLPETKVNDRPAVGVKASSKGHPDVSLYFDKDTHLLAKVARTTKMAGLTVNKEYLFSDYKEFDGVKLPSKEVTLINGRKWTDMTINSYKFPKQLAKDMFSRP